MDVYAAIQKETQDHPLANHQDVLKLIIQSTLGAGHMVQETESLLNLIEEKKFSHQPQPLQEIGNDFLRVPLSIMEDEDLFLWNLLFVSGANIVQKKEEQCKLWVKKFGLETVFTEEQIQEAMTKGIHHSSLYQQTYQPHYRVIQKSYVDVFPVLKRVYQRMHTNEKLCIRIDGPCASGKSSLASILQQIFRIPVFHMDDYFLQPHQRTHQRLQEIGGNVDYERVKKEIYLPIQNETDWQYQPFDCQTQTLKDTISVQYHPFLIIEGSYAHHPYLDTTHTMNIFLSCDSTVQKKRLLDRSALLYERFLHEWIPKEQAYFQKYSIQQNADYCFDTSTF